jgi:cob(I)alamin adenosyltransferase
VRACTADDVRALEHLIDGVQAELPPLRVFILPGGSAGGSLLHLARTVARRAERRVVALGRAEPLNPEVLRYLNRLSDLLFVLARAVNQAAGRPETPWDKDAG